MSVVMVLGLTALGEVLPATGLYLKSFDFEAHDGVGEADMTDDEAHAKHFSTMDEAVTFLLASPECRPLRDDGKPNRPLTSTDWEFREL